MYLSGAHFIMAGEFDCERILVCLGKHMSVFQYLGAYFSIWGALQYLKLGCIWAHFSTWGVFQYVGLGRIGAHFSRLKLRPRSWGAFSSKSCAHQAQKGAGWRIGAYFSSSHFQPNHEILNIFQKIFHQMYLHSLYVLKSGKCKYL